MNRVFMAAVVTSAILGLVVGGVLGAHEGADHAKDMESVMVMITEDIPSKFAATQFRHADADHARSALVFAIRNLEDVQRLNPSPAAGARFMFSYTRLGIVEEAAGHPAAAHAAFDQARTWERKSARRPHPATDMSDTELKDTLQRSEQQWKIATERMAEIMKKTRH
jgi:hypothetical protein